MRLRLAPVEYKVCPADETEYEGARCPVCRRPFAAEDTTKTVHDRLVLVGVDPPIYEREAGLRCNRCGNLYEALACPLCGAPKPQRSLIVWRRTFTKPESLEELQRRELLPGQEWQEDRSEAETLSETVADAVQEVQGHENA